MTRAEKLEEFKRKIHEMRIILHTEEPEELKENVAKLKPTMECFKECWEDTPTLAKYVRPFFERELIKMRLDRFNATRISNSLLQLEYAIQNTIKEHKNKTIEYITLRISEDTELLKEVQKFIWTYDNKQK